jgi:gamma-glutamylcyclotransferase (GGCT)/AIG2-like uncharacterized protein YtfP
MSILFTYGSLMVDRVWNRVLNCPANTHRAAPATLQGFQRFCVRGETYPGLVHSAADRVVGVAYFEVTPAQIELLDRFEGHHYRREYVNITISGSVVVCETYLFLAHARLTPEPWTLEQFDEASFMRQYVGFSAQ